MLTQRHPQTQRPGRVAPHLGPGWWIAILSLVALVVAVMIGNGAFRSQVTAPTAVPFVSAPLGIQAPEGVDLSELPRGYTDYVLPAAPEVPFVSVPLGIQAPEGVDLSEMPRGYTDYILTDR